jgi:alpha-galactosidase
MKIFISWHFLILFLFSLKVQAQQENHQSIITTENPRGWIIQTHSSVYQLILTTEGQVQQVYYGTKEQASHQKKNAQWINGADEIPVRGAFPTKTPLLEVVFADHVRDAELTFVNAEILDIQGRQALKIIQKDRYYPLEITSFIRVLPEFDILEKWVSVKNTDKKNSIKIENPQSASVNLPPDVYNLTHMAGEWGHEFQLRHTKLTEGIKTLQA